MIRTKLGLLGLCAVVLGMMAMSASAQGATFSWLVLDKNGENLENLPALLAGENDSEHYTLLAHALGLAINVTCTSFELVGVELENGGKLKAGGKVKFTGCEVYETSPLTNPLDCMVHTAGAPAKTIETTPGKGELVLHTPTNEVLTKIEPTVPANGFVTLIMELCSIPGAKISGVLYLKDCLKHATTHELKHLVEQGPLTSLQYGSDTEEHLNTSLMGSGFIKLAGAHAGLLWAAMDKP